MALAFSSTVRFPDDKVVYFVPNWDELTELCYRVSLELKEDGHRFPVMVTLAKGGLPLARILADFLQIPVILSMGVHFYTGIDTKLATPEIYQDISPADTLRGREILLFDDVADSGESLLFAQEYLMAQGASSVVTSALFYKEKSKIVPDYFGQLNNNWIVFPFEAIETVRYLSARWQTQNIPPAEQYQRFLKFGIQEHWLTESMLLE